MSTTRYALNCRECGHTIVHVDIPAGQAAPDNHGLFCAVCVREPRENKKLAATPGCANIGEYGSKSESLSLHPLPRVWPAGPRYILLAALLLASAATGYYYHELSHETRTK